MWHTRAHARTHTRVDAEAVDGANIFHADEAGGAGGIDEDEAEHKQGGLDFLKFCVCVGEGWVWVWVGVSMGKSLTRPRDETEGLL